MEINKSCLDCEFSMWGNKDNNVIGVCRWMFPFPLPKWLKGADILEVHGYNVKRKINKEAPYIDCPGWKIEKVKE